jgi:hypothetical protein
MFRVTKTMDMLSEHAKLEYIRVRLYLVLADQANSIAGDWIHTYADSRRSANIFAAIWVFGTTLQG